MTATPDLSSPSKPRCETRLASLSGSTSRIFEASSGASPLPDLPIPRATARVEVKTYQIVTGPTPVSGFWSITFSADVFDSQRERMQSSNLVMHNISGLPEKYQAALSDEELWKTAAPHSSIDVSLEDRWQRELASFASELSKLSVCMEQLSGRTTFPGSPARTELASLDEIVRRDLAKFAADRCAEILDATFAPSTPCGKTTSSSTSKRTPILRNA